MISEVFNMDCVAYMQTLPDIFFDLAIVDPPYGIGESSKNHTSRNTPITQKNGVLMKAPKTNYKKKDWDKKPPEPVYFQELKRVSKRWFVFGANYYPEICGTPFKAPKREDYDKFISEHPKGWIIWDKVNGGNDFNDCEPVYTNMDIDSYVLPYMWNGMMQGKSIHEPYTMQGNKKLNENRIHPTQKPVVLYRALIQKYAQPGWKIFDSHMGSQSSRIAAYHMGFDYWGCELDEEYFNNGNKRFIRETMQQSLFTPTIAKKETVQQNLFQ